MSKLEKFKAAFLPNGNLQKKLRERVNTALGDIESARSLAETLPQDQRPAALSRIEGLEAQIIGAAAAGARSPGDGWVLMNDLCKQATQEKAKLGALAKPPAKESPADRIKRLDATLKPTRQALSEARLGTRDIPQEREANQLMDAVATLEKQVETLVRVVADSGAASADHCTQMQTYRVAAGDLVREVRGAQGLAPIGGTQRAATRALVDGVGQIPGFGDRLNANTKDPQGRTAKQDVLGRLEVFDRHFAEDPDTDPKAGARNTAMRVAAVATVSADRIAKDVNDPYIAPRIGRALIEEYEPELGLKLSEGEDDDDTDKALKLARALVMDDPVTKLMTGKLDPIDAVQRIRDMAEAGGEEPSVMLRLLRQQFEMRIASLSFDEVKKGKKEDDRGADGNFALQDITGELSPDQFNEITDTTLRSSPSNLGNQSDVAQWKQDGGGLQLRPGVGEVYTVKAGDTFGSIAQAKLGDKTRWNAIRDKNKAVDVGGTVHKLQTLGADAALPIGAQVVVPTQTSLLDQLEPYLAAWDDAEKQPPPKAPKDRTRQRPTRVKGTGPTRDDLDEMRETQPEITPEALRAAFAKLRSPKNTARDADGNALDQADPSWIQVPGLGQDHAPRAPLGSDTESKEQGPRARDGRNAAETEALQGAVNGRQYAHLRMLARADEEDRAAVLAKEGKTAEEAVEEKIIARYGPNRVTPELAKKIAKAAEKWIATVPLTLTFTADRLFSPDKDGPVHGPQYKSDVELTRGREKMEDLIGRDDKGAGEVGTQGGSKTITGWKSRGENYMRWRRDKDNREGRHDDLDYEDQQIFTAANPAFSKTKGGTGGDFGTNYYGSAHFLVNDACRNRCAFIVRAGGAAAPTPPVQRKDIGMLIYDMLKTSGENAKFFDAMMSIASGASTVTSPNLNWEAHLYGGFDLRKDAAAAYLPNDIDDNLRARIEAFCKNNGIQCGKVGAKPNGLELKAEQNPTAVPLPPLP
jgi:hypothetical protein